MRYKLKLGWVPMLIQAYREAQQRTGMNHDVTTAASAGFRNETRLNNAATAPAKRSTKQTPVPRKKKPATTANTRVTRTNAGSDSQRVIREVRKGNRKSWNQLEMIDKKVERLESKIERLNEELRNVREQQPSTQKPSQPGPSPMGPANPNGNPNLNPNGNPNGNPNLNPYPYGM